jgi:hypothetical protein
MNSGYALLDKGRVEVRMCEALAAVEDLHDEEIGVAELTSAESVTLG